MSSRTGIAAGRKRTRPRAHAQKPPISLTFALTAPAYFRRKGIVDRTVAVLLLIPGLPLIALLVLLVRLTSRGPGIYRQSRVGKNGRPYQMYKIRTMRHDAETATGAVWCRSSDIRITPLGKWLRRLHLDELPQLINVFKGEMSLVGPRPERPEFVHVLAEAIPGYFDRLAVLPGITGLAQLNLPPDTDLGSVQRKLVLDRQYIETAGPWLDLRLLMCTFGRMFKFPERLLLPLFGLRRTVTVPETVLATSGGSGDDKGTNHRAATPAGVAEQARRTAAGGNGGLGASHYAHAGKAKVKPR